MLLVMCPQIGSLSALCTREWDLRPSLRSAQAGLADRPGQIGRDGLGDKPRKLLDQSQASFF